MISLLVSKMQKVMKKNLFILSAIAVTAAALISCNKEQNVINNEEPQGIPFEIVASSIETKTVNAGMSTTWLSTDQINLFHAVHGIATYNNDSPFTAKEAGASVGFTGTLKAGSEPTSGNTYDWFAVYPYKSGFNSPSGTKTITIPQSQTQTGKDSKAHLANDNCPVAGNVLDVAYDAQPVVAMEHLTSIAKVHVTNDLLSNSIVVYSVSITASVAEIAGKFKLDLTGAHPALTADDASKTAKLTVEDCPMIAAGSSADFFIAIKPFTAAAGTTITLKVATNRGTKEVTSAALGSDFEFVAGKIHNLNFNYNVDNPASIPFSIDGNATAGDYAAKAGLYISDGITPNGYTNDTHADYRAKWDKDGAFLQVYFTSAAGKVTFPVKMIGGATTSTMTLSGSADGHAFTDIMDFTIEGSANAILNFDSGLTPIDDSYRFLRLTFTKGANVGVGTIAIAAPSSDPEIEASDISGIDALGVTNATKTYAVNFADDITVTCDGTIVTSATKTSNGVVTYTVAPYYGYSPATRVGTITLTSPSKSINKVISVNQAKDDFKVNNLTTNITVTIPNDGTSTTFSLLSQVMSWGATVTPGDGMNLSMDPSSGDKNASARTITVSSTIAATAAEQTLGTIVVYRNGNTSDTQRRTITVKKAAAASGTTYTKATSISAGTFLLCDATVGNTMVSTAALVTISKKTYLNATSVSISTNVINGSATIDGYEFTIAALTGTDAGKYTIHCANGYLGHVSTSTDVTLTAEIPDGDDAAKYKWTIDIDDETGLATITNCSSSRILAFYNHATVRAYASLGTNTLPTLFKKN